MSRDVDRRRRTQGERSAAMRTRLLDATLASLEELGYARTSTVEVARRAGVSRGAQLHHFPTKAHLVTDAVRHLFDRRHAEFVAAIGHLGPDAAGIDAAIDLLWSMVRGPTFVVWLELAVAARTDAELAEPFGRLTREFVETVEKTFRALFPAPDRPNPFFDVAPRFAFSLLDGLALERLAAMDDSDCRRVVDTFKLLAALVLPGGRPARPENDGRGDDGRST